MIEETKLEVKMEKGKLLTLLFQRKKKRKTGEAKPITISRKRVG